MMFVFSCGFRSRREKVIKEDSSSCLFNHRAEEEDTPREEARRSRRGGEKKKFSSLNEAIFRWSQGSRVMKTKGKMIYGYLKRFNLCIRFCLIYSPHSGRGLSRSKEILHARCGALPATRSAGPAIASQLLRKLISQVSPSPGLVGFPLAAFFFRHEIASRGFAAQEEII
jgi:hypothetical protein